MLPRRKLGRSGLEITPVGFGAWAIGGGGWSFGWGQQDDKQSVATIRHAVELGINWIDTAPVYGLGHSEEVIGRALREIFPSQRPLIFTKCGLLWDSSDPYGPLRPTLRPDTLRKEVEDSLRRLGIETLDLYQIHAPPMVDSAPLEDSWAEMAKLLDEGKVRAIGVSAFDADLMQHCEAVRHVDSLQTLLSLIHRESVAELVPHCAAHESGVIVYSPLQNGLLTDRFSVERVGSMGDDDWRTRNPEFILGQEFVSPRLGRNIALRDALRPVAQRHDTNVAAIAVAWTLAWPGVTGAIVGARSPEQVDGWIAAASLELSAADLDEIDRAIERTGAGEGPRRET